MKFKLNGKYLQIWDEERNNCVSGGNADKLVNKILDEEQTKKLREKLTKISEGNI